MKKRRKKYPFHTSYLNMLTLTDEFTKNLKTMYAEESHEEIELWRKDIIKSMLKTLNIK